MKSVLQATVVHYPESDGKPMGETDLHRDEMVRHIELLRHYYRGQKVYVSGDLLVYYEQGNPKKFVVPDAFVAKGVAPKKRRIFRIWVERKAPDVIIETTSRKTRQADLKTKPELYARLGVKEYFLFDPDHEYLDPPLLGYRLAGETYQPIPLEEDGSLISEQLGLRLSDDAGRMMFVRLDNGHRLLTAEERAEHEGRARRAEARARRAEAEARHVEAEARQAAEAEVARLREELARLRREN
jgi:Uma2 family endonuclease